MSKISQMFLEQKIYGDGFRLAHLGLFGCLIACFPLLFPGIIGGLLPSYLSYFYAILPRSWFPTAFSTASLHGSCVRPSLCECISNGSDFRLLLSV